MKGRILINGVVTYIDRSAMVDSIESLMIALNSGTDDNVTSLNLQNVDSFRQHVEGWTDQMLITTYIEYASKMINRFNETKK